MKTKVLSFILLSAAAILLGASAAHAAPAATSTIVSISLPNPLKLDNCNGKSDLECLTDKITKAMIVFAFPFLTLMLLLGAYQLMSAGASPENIEKGWTTIRYAILGFVVILLATIIVSIVQGVFREITSGASTQQSQGTVPSSSYKPPCGDTAPTGSCPAGKSCLYVGGHYGCYGADSI